MAVTTVRVEDIMGKKVLDASGELVGRIEEIVMVPTGSQDNDWVVKEYRVGVAALFERLAALTFLDVLLRVFYQDHSAGWIIPWNKLDLSDPLHPRLLGKRADLEPLEG